MADPRFFTKSAKNYTITEIADITGCEIKGTANAQNLTITDVASLAEASSGQISFWDNAKYKNDFINSKAGACFVREKALEFAPSHMVLLVSAHPYKSYAKAASYIYPDPFPEASISADAHIEDGAQIEKGCIIEAGAVIKSGAKIGAGSWIESGAVIGRNVQIGEKCRIGPQVSLSHCLIGDNVRLYPGVRIGQDGFGFAIDPQGHVKVPQLGRVIIEDHVEIGANTTIDRGAGPDTIIGQGTWIDNLVQIGHNVQIGKGCIIVSQAGISGSTQLGDFVAMGGQSGIAGHLKIGSGARIAGQSGVMRDIPAGEEQMGSPSMPLKQFMRQIATLAKLAKK
ncbi:MAG: UDP-3-O-(3-hydroxymyristoyl)glucosamine N-acyltransferase [Alphaproteobacteria bacterium]